MTSGVGGFLLMEDGVSRLLLDGTGTPTDKLLLEEWAEFAPELESTQWFKLGRIGKIASPLLSPGTLSNN